MPELPEVEVTRRQIRRVLVGRTVSGVETTRSSYFFLTRPAELKARLVGRRFVELERVGKYLLAELDDGSHLLLHLGMTGQLFAAGATSPRLLSATAKRALAPEAQGSFAPDAHTHLVLTFREKGPNVYFRDVRKFGKVAWIAKGREHERLSKLGVDALRANGETLWEATRKRSAPIKTVLLDQEVIAGIGNIYADEALFLAGVRVTRPARRLSRAECDADAAVATRVNAMLQSELSAEQAVQIALLNNRRLQATYEDLMVAQADLVSAGLLRNPVFDAEIRFPASGSGGTGRGSSVGTWVLNSVTPRMLTTRTEWCAVVARPDSDTMLGCGTLSASQISFIA